MARVAVVAVHGVADQKPSHSARSIADLLCSQEGFGAFAEVPVRVRRKPALVADQPPADCSLAFMHGQLEKYDQHDAGATYDTVRLEGKRANGDTVDVHEVYWADLSRPGESWYRLIGELYQLLLHLPSLGRDTTDQARDAEAGRGKVSDFVWNATQKLQTWCVRLLTIPIPLINLLILALTVVVLVPFLPAEWHLAVAIATPALAAAAIWMLAVPKPPLLFRWATLPLIAVGVAVVSWLALRRFEALLTVLALEAFAAGLAITYAISRSYAKMRRRADWFAAIAGVVAWLFMLYIAVHVPGTAPGVQLAVLQTFDFLRQVLQFAWGAFTGLACLAALAGAAAIAVSRDRKRANRAMWTARFSLAFPAALFVTTTVSLWLLISNLLSFFLDTVPSPMQPNPFAPISLGEFFAAQVVHSASEGLVIFVAGLALFVAVAVFAVGPSIFHEIAHPRHNGEAEIAGRWLSHGIHAVAWAGLIPTVSLFLLVVFHASNYRPAWMSAWAQPLLYGTSAAIAAVLTTKHFSAAFRGAVDVLLDVDNYLRKSPDTATPRAQIAERYVSLLRHLCRERYDRIVIIAHSQGTVITTDLLRYLDKVKDDELKPLGNEIELKLFTMGSPLRQLYAAAFPHLYDWVDRATATPWDYKTAHPLPGEIRVKVWANVYRSGDYVGRHLWAAEESDYARLFVKGDPLGDDTPPMRVQFCAGAGAHTHYWDRYANDVAKQLAAMI